MKRFNFFKYTTLANKVHTTYFDYWFFNKLTQGEPVTPAVEGEGTDFELVTTSKKKLDQIKLKGDTTQNTLTGKNLLKNIPSGVQTVGGLAFTIEDGAFAINGSTTGAGNCIFKVFQVNNSGDATYSIWFTGTIPNYTNAFLLEVSDNGSSGWTTVSQLTPPTSLQATVQLDNTKYYRFRWYVNGANVQFTNVVIQAQLELGTATSYEPYCGGVPSPNPDYPQDVNVVTGTQTFTITNGTDVQTYPIALGSIELCKIGTYQDYIYKNGDKWYVRKETGKSTLGTLNWNYSDTGTANVYRMYTGGLSGQYVAPADNSSIPAFVCTHFIATNANDSYSCKIGIASNLTGSAVYCYDSDYNTTSSPSAFKTWLSDNNVTLYYALTTPTVTKITDTTLISELNTILADGYLTKGTNVLQTTATGTNLPTIIYVKTN